MRSRPRLILRVSVGRSTPVRYSSIVWWDAGLHTNRQYPNLEFPTGLKMETVSLQRAFRAGSEDEGLLPRLQSLGEHGPRPGLAVLRDRRRRATDTRGDPSAEPWADTGVDGR